MSRIVIRARIEDVWREITRTDVPQPAMFNSRMETLGLRPGSPLRMRSPDGRYTAIVGEILEVDPPRKLVHTLRFTAYGDPYSKVTYQLREVPEGVEFTLISEEVPPGTRTAKDMARGGDFIVNTLKSVVETGRPPFKARLLFVLFRLMAPLNPKRCFSENWPLGPEPSRRD